MKLKAGDDIILRYLFDETISGDFCIVVSMREGFAVLQNLKRNRIGVGFIVVRGFCLDNRIAAKWNISEVYLAGYTGCQFLHFCAGFII